MAESTLKTELEAARNSLSDLAVAFVGAEAATRSLKNAIAHIDEALRDLPADAEDLPEYGQPEIQRYEPEPHE